MYKNPGENHLCIFSLSLSIVQIKTSDIIEENNAVIDREKIIYVYI